MNFVLRWTIRSLCHPKGVQVGVVQRLSDVLAGLQVDCMQRTSHPLDGFRVLTFRQPITD